MLYRNRVSPFLIRKFRNSYDSMYFRMKLIIKLILIILFPMAPTRALSDKYFLSYNFLTIKIICDFLLFFTWFLL